MTNLQQLIADNRWRDIEEAPIGVNLLGKDGIHHYGVRRENNYYSSACGQPVVYEPEPTHFRPLPDNRLADICQALLGALNEIKEMPPHTDHYEPYAVACEALAKAEEIAKGETK